MTNTQVNTTGHQVVTTHHTSSGLKYHHYYIDNVEHIVIQPDTEYYCICYTGDDSPLEYCYYDRNDILGLGSNYHWSVGIQTDEDMWFISQFDKADGSFIVGNPTDRDDEIPDTIIDNILSMVNGYVNR